MSVLRYLCEYFVLIRKFCAIYTYSAAKNLKVADLLKASKFLEYA
jgi:hypothetical protein